MATRPAKRQRRATVIQSDDDETETSTSVQGKRKSTRPYGVTNGRSNATAKSIASPDKRQKKISDTSSPKSSPGKAQKTNKNKVEASNKSLHSFFGRATEEQRWKRKSMTPDIDNEDIIEDDIIDDENELPPNKGGEEEDLRSRLGRSSIASRLRQETPSASQRFAKQHNLARSFTSRSSLDESAEEAPEHKPWADRYGPNDLEELAVHKKKVGDVQKWLQDVLAGRTQKKLLVLKGPAGTGKTNTILLLAKTLGLEIISWHNTTVSEAGSASNTQQFNDFLNIGGTFGSLSFQQVSSLPSSDLGQLKHVLMIEEFPTPSRVSSSLNSFRSVVLQYLAFSNELKQFGRPSQVTQPPLIMIVSETLLSSSTALSDSFTAHRLLGTEISNHPLTTVLEFNPVAPTFVQKALDIVIKKEARDSRRRRAPGPAVLQKLAEIGDIRSAINSLEFLCARGDENSDWSGTVAARMKKKDRIPLTEMEKNTLKLVSQRESTLDMFHAAGKIVYNKREDPRVQDTRAEPPPKPPDHLLHLYTEKASLVDIDVLLNETGTDIQTFISTLHENYVLSCNGDNFTDSLAGCAHILSDSDILNPESRSLIRAKGSVSPGFRNAQGGSSDMLRQDEISFQTTSRGLLFNLPFPVNRAIPPGARKQDAFKMFYPGSLRLWKPAEEIYDLISLYANPSQKNMTSNNSNEQVSGVSAWKSRDFGIQAAPTSPGRDEADEARLTGDPPFALITRNTYTTDILPYMYQIQTAQGHNTQSLKKITQLLGTGIGIGMTLLSDEPDETEDQDQDHHQQQQHQQPLLASKHARNKSNSTSLNLSLGQKIEAAHNSIKSQNKNRTKNEAGAVADNHTAMEKLYISDDDIQDD